MGIKFLCPNGHKMNVKAFLAGKRGKCPKCGASVRIPQETPASDSGDDLLGEVAETAPGKSAAVAEPVGTAVAAPATVGAATMTAAAPAVPVGTPQFPLPGRSIPAGPAVPAGAPAIPLSTPAYVPTAVPVSGDPIGQAPTAIWYVRPPSGGQYGPARGDIMRKWVAEGRVSGDSLVWREGFAEWKPAGQLFPSLAGASPSAGLPPPPPSESQESPKVSRVTRKLSAYESRRNQGNGVAIAILVVLGLICVALVIGLAVVLSQGNNSSTKEAPKKSAAAPRVMTRTHH